MDSRPIAAARLSVGRYKLCPSLCPSSRVHVGTWLKRREDGTNQTTAFGSETPHAESLLFFLCNCVKPSLLATYTDYKPINKAHSTLAPRQALGGLHKGTYREGIFIFNQQARKWRVRYGPCDCKQVTFPLFEHAVPLLAQEHAMKLDQQKRYCPQMHVSPASLPGPIH